MKRKKTKLPKNYMDLHFIPRPDQIWEQNEEGMVVLDMEHTGFFPAIAQKFFHRPRVSHIHLDAYGSALWSALDGVNTVHDLITYMEKTFPDEKDRMTDRTVTFLHTLQVNHFIEMKEPGT